MFGISFTSFAHPSFANSKSILFDGIDDDVTLGQPANLEWDPDVSQVTMSLWFNPAKVDAQQYILAKAKMSVANISYVIAVNSDGSVFAIVGGNTNGSGSVSVGVWYHLLLTIRDVAGTKTFFLYLNNVLVGTGAAGSDQNLDRDWLVGAARWDTNGSNSFAYQGKVDEVTFWNTAFSASDVTAIYNSGHPKNPNTHTQAANLLHWYRMGDSDTYPTVIDQKGSANGTCEGMTSGAVNFVSSVP